MVTTDPWRPADPGRIRFGRGQRGTATLVVLAALALCAVMTLVVAQLGVAATGRARADAVADLVALAGVVDGRATAERVGAANSASVVGWRRVGEIVVVDIRLGAASGVAAAAPVPAGAALGSPG